MHVSKALTNWWRRASAASKTDAVLAIASTAAVAYAVAFAIWMGGAQYSAWHGPSRFAFWIFATCLAFTTAQPYFPKRQPKKWVVEDWRRTKTLGVAISQISSAMWNRRFRPEDRQEVFTMLLAAVKSEIEGITGDHQGIYFNVSLLLEDERKEHLRVVCRANHDRPQASYKKSELLISECLASGERFYTPSCNLPDKPYKAIFAMPLISGPENARMYVSGVLSIDSAEANCFDGLEDEIEVKTLPYLSLLKLAIVAEEALSTGRWKQNARKC